MKRILFQGDSITDVHRSRDDDRFMGCGYPTLVSGSIGVDFPGKYEFLNRGISGHRIVDTYAAIKKNIINLKPDILSILIGINGVWHEISEQNGVSAVKYEMIYDLMLGEIKEALPDVKLVILEPFVLYGSVTCPSAEHPERWEVYERETPLRAQAARRIAEKYGAIFVPLQEKFDEASKKAPADYWLMDGVHPTAMGHEIIARAWREAAVCIL